MKRREMEKMLKEAGFWLKKVGSKHIVWTNGHDEISLSFGSKISPHTLASFKSKMRRAKKEHGQNPRGKVFVWGIAVFGVLAAISAFAKSEAKRPPLSPYSP